MWAFALNIVVSVVIGLESEISAQPEFKRVCYTTNWSQNRTGANWYPEDIDADLCTHIHFAFAVVDENQLLTTHPNDEDLYRRTIAKKKENPKLKVLLVVGGGSLNRTKLWAMLSTLEKRNKFITNAIGFLRARGFDGLDFGFGYLGTPSSIPADTHGVTLFRQEVRIAFNKEGLETARDPLQLSVTVSAGNWPVTTNKVHDIAGLSAAVDYINLIDMNMDQSWDSNSGVNFNSPQLPATCDGQDQLNIWTAHPASKLVVGLPFYGLTYTLSDPMQNGIGAAAVGPGNPGPYTQLAGILAYYEICQLLNDPTWTKVNSTDQQKFAYMYKGDQWIGYDDQQSFKAKIELIKLSGYGGVAIWPMDFDDFSGKFCGQGRYPLLNQLKALS